MQYLEILDGYRDEMIDSLAELVRIKSTEEDPYPGEDGAVYPYGQGVEEVYQATLALGKSMGFSIRDVDHYGGHIEWVSENPDADTFGIAAHVDVVPEGDGWTHEPYGAEIEDGWMYGRGTTDDKGPLIEVLYAMKALKEAGLKPDNNIRLIVGLNEETGKSGLVRYLESAGMPDYGITPDGDFPLINGEMGIMTFDLIRKLHKRTRKDGLVLTKLEAGTAPNTVPNHARAVLASADTSVYDRIKEQAKLYSEESEYEISVRKAGTSLAIETRGIAAHGARPDLGLNAISIMMEFLGRLEFAGEDLNEFIAYYNEHIGFNVWGENMGIGFEDKPSGKLIFNVGMAECTDEVASVTINLRYPVTCTDEQVNSGIEATLEGTNIGVLKKMHEYPVYIDDSDEFVQKLLKAYRDETGDQESQPAVIGGGTYAKRLQRTLAFGALFPGDEDRMHQADERINIDSMMKAARVYARMLRTICFKEID